MAYDTSRSFDRALSLQVTLTGTFTSTAQRLYPRPAGSTSPYCYVRCLVSVDGEAPVVGVIQFESTTCVLDAFVPAGSVARVWTELISIGGSGEVRCKPIRVRWRLSKPRIA